MLTLVSRVRYSRGVRSDRKLKVAEEICVLYGEAIHSAFPKKSPFKQPRKMECNKCGDFFFTHSTQDLCDECRPRRATSARLFAELSDSDQKHFLAAARMCIELKCDPRAYIAAQFSMWREASAYHKKLLWPMPMHLGKLAAKVKFIQHQAREQIRISRIGEDEDQDENRRWYVEERRLKGLARMQRRDPIEVITENPEQFSREFLIWKDVWNVVRDLWEERHE